MKKVISIFMCAVFMLSFFSCSKPKDVEITEQPQEPVIVKDQNFNPLTGQNNLADVAVDKRPVSIMISNIKKALPQRGITSADIAYEVLVEGGITRIMGVFADYTKIPQVGPVRSVRHYYPELALPLNTVFVHWGGSNQGYNAIKTKGVENIDGMAYSNISFITDKTLASQKGREHSNFAYGEGIQKGIEKKGYDLNYENAPAFNFVKEGESATLTTGTADYIMVPFSQYCKAEFEYDAQTGKYKKSQFSQPHIDANNNQQVEVDNVFIVYADVSVIDAPSGLLDIKFASGSGYYVSQGKYQSVNYTKSSSTSGFVFKTPEGEEIKVNPGKSWVCVLNKTAKSSTLLESRAQSETEPVA